jgi:hypothetical protein
METYELCRTSRLDSGGQSKKLDRLGGVRRGYGSGGGWETEATAQKEKKLQFETRKKGFSFRSREEREHNGR